MFLIMNRQYFIVFLIFSFLAGQVEFKHECSREGSANRWVNAQSTLTENQDKLDISYYGIDLDIDFDSEIIIGSVVINGYV